VITVGGVAVGPPFGCLPGLGPGSGVVVTIEGGLVRSVRPADRSGSGVEALGELTGRRAVGVGDGEHAGVVRSADQRQ
jgi:hypothetical protein